MSTRQLRRTVARWREIADWIEVAESGDAASASAASAIREALATLATPDPAHEVVVGPLDEGRFREIREAEGRMLAILGEE